MLLLFCMLRSDMRALLMVPRACSKQLFTLKAVAAFVAAKETNSKAKAKAKAKTKAQEVPFNWPPPCGAPAAPRCPSGHVMALRTTMHTLPYEGGCFCDGCGVVIHNGGSIGDLFGAPAPNPVSNPMTTPVLTLTYR